MAEYIKPVAEKALEALEARMPALCDGAGIERPHEYGRNCAWVMENPPTVWVLPLRTTFDPDIQGVYQEAHELLVRVGITGSERDDLTTLAMQYLRLAQQALEESVEAREWEGIITGGQVQRVFIALHDYGPVYTGTAGIARFPEMVVLIDTVEAL